MNAKIESFQIVLLNPILGSDAPCMCRKVRPWLILRAQPNATQDGWICMAPLSSKEPMSSSHVLLRHRGDRRGCPICARGGECGACEWVVSTLLLDQLQPIDPERIHKVCERLSPAEVARISALLSPCILGEEC